MNKKDKEPLFRDKKYYWRKKTLKEKGKFLTVAVLDSLLAIPEALTVGVQRRSIYNALSDCSDHELTVQNICQFFHGLKRSGYIEVKKLEDGQESVRFTNKAKLRVIDTIANSLEWDGKYRLISFDIPERLRKNRDAFRRSIKRMGFKQIQESLWVIQKNIGELVEMTAAEYEVEQYIAYIVAEKTDIDGAIGKMFSINISNK